MWLREQGHVFDWGTLKWCQMYATPPNGCYDAETIALDEFGHIEILGHHDNYDDDRDYLDAVVQTFSRTKPRAGYDMHVLGRCDVATLQREYDVVDSIAKYSTCLDIDTRRDAVGPATVAYGGTAASRRSSRSSIATPMTACAATTCRNAPSSSSAGRPGRPTG